MGLVGLIPAAGKGTRLHPLPFSKELYPIGYHEVLIDQEKKLRPKVVSQYLVNHMKRMGVEKIIITLGPGKSDIMDYYGSGQSLGLPPISYNFQSVPRGMPYALDLSFPWLKKDDVIVFGMSDTIIEPENAFNDLKNTFFNQQPDLLLGLFPTNNPKKFGMVDFDSQGKVIATIDKPQTTSLTHMWGCCLWNYHFADFMHQYLKGHQSKGDKELVFGDILNLAIKKGLKVLGQPVLEGRYIDIGTIEDLDQALKHFHL